MDQNKNIIGAQRIRIQKLQSYGQLLEEKQRKSLELLKKADDIIEYQEKMLEQLARAEKAISNLGNNEWRGLFHIIILFIRKKFGII